MDMALKDAIERAALINAVQHKGIASPKAVLGRLLAENPAYRSNAEQIEPEVWTIVARINKLKAGEQRDLLKDIEPKFLEKKEKVIEKKELPDLKGAKEGKVIMRLAPYPSGALHIGNAKTYMLNALYCEKYKGKLLFVMDDTIGSAEKYITPDAYKLMPEGFKWLGVKWDGPILYKSKRMEKYYRFAEQLINKGLAYVCECPVQTLRDNRLNGKDCACRSNSAKTNLKKWKAMLARKYKEGQVALRLKTSMQHPNPAFRDRVLAKIVERPHPKVGRKYAVWPTLELSWAYDDYDIHSTHIFRGKDLMIESDTCRFIWEKLGWKVPEMLHTGMIRLKGVKLSKSKALKEVEEGKYSGWDDPRTWSLQSLKRRGFLPESIREFIKDIGPNRADIEIPIDNLYAINRQLIDPLALRYSFVPEPVKISVLNQPDISEVSVPVSPYFKNRKKINVGKDIWIAKADLNEYKGKEIRLKGLFNVKLKKKAEFTSLKNKDIQKIQWVSAGAVKAEVLMPDGSVVKGLAEPTIKKLKIGDILQFERFGFVRFDKKGRVLLFCFGHK